MLARSWLPFAIVSLLAAGSAPTATERPRHASQCVTFENPAELYRRSEVVFAGTVVATRATGATTEHSIVAVGTFKVERSWKAQLPAEIRVGNDQPWVVGKQYVVFGGDKAVSTSTQCRWAQPIEEANAKLDWLSSTVRLIDIYSVLLRQSYHGVQRAAPAAWTVHEAGIPMPTLRGSSSEWLAQFSGMPEELRRFAMEKQPAIPHAIDQSLLPPGTPLGRSEAKDRPGDPMTIAFSSVLYTREGLDALVYYDAVCGGLCAEAGYAWLHRGNHQGPWRLAKKVVRRVS